MGGKRVNKRLTNTFRIELTAQKRRVLAGSGPCVGVPRRGPEDTTMERSGCWTSRRLNKKEDVKEQQEKSSQRTVKSRRLQSVMNLGALWETVCTERRRLDGALVVRA